MATYTTRIRLSKQATGENDSTWGTVLNDEVMPSPGTRQSALPLVMSA
jgi:hypothetical protein